METKSGEWLTPSQLRAWLQLGRSTIYTLLREELPAYRLGKVLRVRRQDVERWLENNKVRSGKKQ